MESNSILFLIIGLLIGACLREMFGLIKKISKDGISNPFKQLKGHISPSAWRYKGGFADITECQDCGSTGFYWDQHPVNPCRSCGGNIREVGAAKWERIDGVYQWVKKKKVKQ